MLLDFEGFLCDKKFENSVLPLMLNTKNPFSYYKEEFDALIILEKQPLFFVFLKYVPTGHNTHLPTLKQSIENENGEPRQSKGEWVVETIFQTRQDDAKAIFEKVENLGEDDKIISFIREELHRF